VQLSTSAVTVEDRLFGMRWRRLETTAPPARGVAVETVLSLRSGENWRAWRRIALLGAARPIAIADGLSDGAEARLVQPPLGRRSGLAVAGIRSVKLFCATFGKGPGPRPFRQDEAWWKSPKAPSALRPPR